MRIKSLLLAAVALATAATPAMAHRQWLLPSATIFSGTDAWVTVDGAASNDLFFPDHQPLRLDGVKAWAPDGTEAKIENGATGRHRSMFDVKLDKPGTWKIGTAQESVSGTFKVDGVEWRVGGRRGPPPPPGAPAQPNSVAGIADVPANATDLQITQSASRNEIYVTTGEPTDTIFQPTNKGLEMVPVTHPSELVADEPARFKFLVDGKPAANLKISVLPGGKRYRDDDGLIEVVTGADGVAQVNWSQAGMFWLNTTYSDDKPTIPRATARRLSFTTTLEVMAP
ncbi:MAG TPA: DUF4198 domain-containing protein [Sphingobium sp.]|nr:DUF4198 domain-containing protein [Sphingobium sp.]